MGNESTCCCQERREQEPSDTVYSSDQSTSTSETAENREAPTERLNEADSADRAIDEAQNAKREAAMLVCCL